MENPVLFAVSKVNVIFPSYGYSVSWCTVNTAPFSNVISALLAPYIPTHRASFDVRYAYSLDCAMVLARFGGQQ